MYLEGERVRLRPAEVSDAPRFVEWINDSETRHLLGGPAYPVALAEEEEFLRGKQDVDWEHGVFLCIEATDGTAPLLIGSIDLRHLHAESRKAEVGILVGDRAYWGRGYGSDALRTLCRFAFDELDLHRIELDLGAYNPRAQRAYEKVGFVLEGRRRDAMYIAGRYYDQLEMGLLRADFEAE